jgi:ribosomal protein S18 acetylase RimI-like enzyme
VTHYRYFRNGDVPALVALWNAGMGGRGAARPVSCTEFDILVLSKPYFDPQGLTLAFDDAEPVGFCHAGFGACTDQSGIDCHTGSIAMVVVRPDRRRRGVGRELVRRAEHYLRAGGATVLYAGGMSPIDPFYLGLYGGSELPGILESDAEAHALFRSLGYQPADTCLVYHRVMSLPVVSIDPRLRTWTRQLRYDIHADGGFASFWAVAQRGQFEQYECVAADATGRVLARAGIWPLLLLERTWGQLSVGIHRFDVLPEERRRGIGRWLLFNLLRQLRDDGVQRIEVQTMERNTAARGLYESLGFRIEDRGIIYRAPASVVGSQ